MPAAVHDFSAIRVPQWHHLLMDQDDPEKRIAELERQLAEAHAAGDPNAGQRYQPTGGRLTPEQVRTMAFSKPPIGMRGYNEDEVDAFLDRVEAALRDPTGCTFTPEQVRDMAFSKPPIGKRGYNEDEVDAFLDRVEAQLKSQPGGVPPRQQTGLPPPPTAQLPARHAAGPQTRARRIYDAVVDIVVRTLDVLIPRGY